ncbi:MAG TPA: site-specific integrase [Thermomicrobiales bacterium]|nr:site-specific integrase [Thermomicrobiales bacterium]
MRAALNRALRWGLVERNAAALADPPRIEAKPIQPLTADQVRQFLDAVAADPLGPLFQVAIATGMRQRELFGLRWEDVDLTAATVTVRVALQNVGGTKTFVEPKTPHSRRTIPLPASGVRALRAQHARQNGQRLAAGSRWQEWGLVFTARYGTPLDGSNVGARLKKALQAADLPRQRFHDLRHCSASLLLQGGVGMRTIMGRLGHSQISLTMNTYTHLSPELERDAADALDRMIERPKPEGKHATRTDQATQDLG